MPACEWSELAGILSSLQTTFGENGAGGFLGRVGAAHRQKRIGQAWGAWPILRDASVHNGLGTELASPSQSSSSHRAWSGQRAQLRPQAARRSVRLFVAPAMISFNAERFFASASLVAPGKLCKGRNALVSCRVPSA